MKTYLTFGDYTIPTGNYIVTCKAVDRILNSIAHDGWECFSVCIVRRSWWHKTITYDFHCFREI